MVANWHSVIERLRANMLRQGIRLPERPIADNRWHECDGGHYFLFAAMPHRALYRPRSGEIQEWRGDGQLTSLSHQQVIAFAAMQCPPQRSQESRRSPPCHPHRYHKVTARVRTRNKVAARPPQGLAQHVATPGSALAKARTALQKLLAHNAVPTREIRARAGRAGLAWITVRRAAAILNVRAERVGFGAGGKWIWRLP